MAKAQIKHKPLTRDQYNQIHGKYPLVDLSLNTGARTMELKRIVDNWDGESNYIDIKTKYSGKNKNRLWLNKNAIDALKRLDRNYYKGKVKRTYQRHLSKILKKYGEELENHNLRSTFATRLATLGIDIYVIQQLMNHANISQTAKYINLAETKLSTASEMLVDYETMEGYTLPEALKEIGRQREKLKRQEKEIERMKMLIKGEK